VVCTLDRYVIGGYYRVHGSRSADDPLNTPGASVVPMAFAEPSQPLRPGGKAAASAPNRFYMYGVVARLGLIAASYELEATDPDAEVYA
jgi:glutamate--cysteine ligase